MQPLLIAPSGAGLADSSSSENGLDAANFFTRKMFGPRADAAVNRIGILWRDWSRALSKLASAIRLRFSARVKLLHLFFRGVIEKSEAQRQILSAKIAGQWRERVRGRNASPRRSIQRNIP
jgi:hypothetical protein